MALILVHHIRSLFHKITPQQVITHTPVLDTSNYHQQIRVFPGLSMVPYGKKKNMLEIGMASWPSPSSWISPSQVAEVRYLESPSWCPCQSQPEKKQELHHEILLMLRSKHSW